jgi:hypothetical protein
MNDQNLETASTILIATWTQGLFAYSAGSIHPDLPGHSVRGLASDGRGGVLAIVDGVSLFRRSPDGSWHPIVTTDFSLSCCVAVGDLIYAGTDDARVLCITSSGEVERLPGFDNVPGRDAWYAGAALIDGKLLGPPLGIRSIAATPGGEVILANVHVGGIPRSLDGGATWHPTIDIDSDVHEVRFHPERPHIAVAAASAGFCISRDAGATWTIEQEGLHASYCSAVAFLGDDVLVSASTDHFASQGAVYRRKIDGDGPLVQLSGNGLPTWFDGIVDTACIATHGSTVAIADAQGNLYLSADSARTWSHCGNGLPAPGSVLIVPA